MADKLEFKSANGVDLVAKNYISVEGYDKGKNIWEVETKEGEYVEWITKYTDKFYSLHFGEIKSFEDFVEIWKTRFIIDGFRPARSGVNKHSTNNYGIDLYNGQSISQEDFKKLVKNIKILLDKGFCVHYNDEHGVGYFDKVDKKYIATHHRHFTENKENMTIKKISQFLRDFFDLGYHYDKKDDWIADAVHAVKESGGKDGLD